MGQTQITAKGLSTRYILMKN
ncbi:MAG: hypothetical protein CM15mV149_150 [uncultured marine virus]|nr:MAG: hypothetical protein CM15mV149_150 [uncultured marine virus]